jgi:hypothetical protein
MAQPRHRANVQVAENIPIAFRRAHIS